jgi:hypothetical protein
MKERCFAYQNKKTHEWLKIQLQFKVYSEGYGYGYGCEVYDSFDRSVMYSARNIIEEDFAKTKVEKREDWVLIEVEIEYTFTRAK